MEEILSIGTNRNVRKPILEDEQEFYKKLMREMSREPPIRVNIKFGTGDDYKSRMSAEIALEIL